MPRHTVVYGMAQNVLGSDLVPCSTTPLTGFYRDGCCNTGPDDHGLHLVCAVMTREFLDFSKNVGNDLSTPRPEFNFPGLQPGDRWCLCVQRWTQALAVGCAPRVVLESTHIHALEWANLDDLKAHAAEDSTR